MLNILSFIVSLLVVILVPVLFLAIVVFLFYAFITKAAKERNDLIDYCKKNGLTYSDSLVGGFPNECSNFKILNKGRGQFFGGIVSGKRDDLDFSIINYSYFVGSNSGRRNREVQKEATLYFFSIENLKMPHFFVRDESFIMDSLGKVFGGQDINFREDPDFSKKFVLQGDNENDVRMFFNYKVRSTFVHYHQQGFVYEGINGYFFVFVPYGCNINKKMQLLTQITKFLPTLKSFGNKENYF